MNDTIVVELWCQLAFNNNLTDQQAQLLDNCAKRILELLDMRK